MGGDYFALCLAIEELARVDSSVAITLEAGGLARRDADLPVRHRGAEARVAAPADLRPDARRVRAHRARRRLRRGRAPARPRRARRRRVGHQRHQGVHHQLRHRHHRPGHRHRGHRHAARTARKEISSIIVPVRHARVHRVGEVLEGRLERLGHPRAVVRRTAGCRRRTCSASGAAATPSSCASSTRAGSRSRRWPSGLAQGCVDESRPPTPSEREAFGRPIGEQPGDRVQDRRHGDARPRRAAGLLRRRRRRMLAGEPFKQRGGDRQALLLGGRGGQRPRGDPGPRRLRLHERVPGRPGIWRDAKILEIGEGTSEVQRMLIARELGL